MTDIWRSQRLLFRAVETEDDAFLQSLNQYGSVGFQNAGGSLPKPQGKAGAVQYRERLEKSLLGCIICLPAVESDTANPDSNVVASKPTPIGPISLTLSQPDYVFHRSTNIGINIVTPYQSQGYGSEAIHWALDWAFRHANMHRVGIGAFEWNSGALRLYERLGFAWEGRNREAYWYHGKYWDMVQMSMLEGEWWEKFGGREKTS